MNAKEQKLPSTANSRLIGGYARGRGLQPDLAAGKGKGRSSLKLPIKLLRPLNFIDCETTGLNIGFDRVVELAILQLRPDGETSIHCWRFNPGIRMSPQAQSVHGLTAKDLKRCPRFSEKAHEVIGVLARCDLAGFNVINFDIPLLFEEFLRAGVEWDLAGINVIDAATIFRLFRDLLGVFH